jgi:hypothetical protein
VIRRSDGKTKTKIENKRKHMPEELKGKKPDTEGGKAKGEEEVGGRTRLYTCWNCGAGNYVPNSWSWFTCNACGALNYT